MQSLTCNQTHLICLIATDLLSQMLITMSPFLDSLWINSLPFQNERHSSLSLATVVCWWPGQTTTTNDRVAKFDRNLQKSAHSAQIGLKVNNSQGTSSNIWPWKRRKPRLLWLRLGSIFCLRKSSDARRLRWSKSTLKFYFTSERQTSWPRAERSLTVVFGASFAPRFLVFWSPR